MTSEITPVSSETTMATASFSSVMPRAARCRDPSSRLKRGLIVANGIGVIDSDYCGPTDEVMIQLLNVTDDTVTVKRGDRLAQGIVLATARVTWNEVDSLRVSARGGFGATGN